MARKTCLPHVRRFATVQICGDMAKIVQYPHFLFIEETPDAVQDEQGYWSESESSRKFLSRCREESDGRSTEYQVAGGKSYKATSVIQLPKYCPKVNKGARVIIANDIDCSDIRISGICLNFDAAQLHSRLWL